MWVNLGTLSVLGDNPRVVFLFLTQKGTHFRRGGHCHKRNVCPGFRQWGRLLCLTFLNCLWVKIILLSKWHIIGVAYADPLYFQRHRESSSNFPFGGICCHLPWRGWEGQSHHFRLRQQDETLLQDIWLQLTEMKPDLTYTKWQFIERSLKNNLTIQWQGPSGPSNGLEGQSWVCSVMENQKVFLIYLSCSLLSVSFLLSLSLFVSTSAFSFFPSLQGRKRLLLTAPKFTGFI